MLPESPCSVVWRERQDHSPKLLQKEGLKKKKKPEYPFLPLTALPSLRQDARPATTTIIAPLVFGRVASVGTLCFDLTAMGTPATRHSTKKGLFFAKPRRRLSPLRLPRLVGGVWKKGTTKATDLLFPRRPHVVCSNHGHCQSPPATQFGHWLQGRRPPSRDCFECVAVLRGGPQNGPLPR